MASGKVKTGHISGCILLMLLLAGCQSVDPSRHSEQAPPTAQEMQAYGEKQCVIAPEGMTQEQCRFYSALQYGILRNFYDADRYAGRKCMVTISWSRHGRYNVLSASGDEALCKKAWGVIGSANYLPSPPENVPARMVIDFQPR